MPDLPTGLVTFLFSDIQGSTKLLLRQGERYAAVLADHQRLLRQAWADHAGVEVYIHGDSFFVVFAHAIDALAAAAQAQRALAAHDWPSGAPVMVRMGLHSGIGSLSGGSYVGLDVHRAERIAAAGHGGQVLLSRATRDQVAEELVVGAGLRDLGRHRLKDLPRREELYQLVLPGLPAHYPPLKTLDAWPGLRADLVAVLLLAVSLLAVAGLLFSLADPTFPWWIGAGAASVAVLLLASTAVAGSLRLAVASQWRDARKPFAAVTSMLLSAVVVTTTLFITKPTISPAPGQGGYDFSYTYHAPPKADTGGAVVVGVWREQSSLAPAQLPCLLPDELALVDCIFQEYEGIWGACLAQLPDLQLEQIDFTASYKPDQCTEVPTISNGGETSDYQTTTFHIDSHAVWSDGVPITADDYLFAYHLYADGNVGNGGSPYDLMQLTTPNEHTVQIHWSVPYPDYLAVLGGTYKRYNTLTPLPWHVYATGPYAKIFDPVNGAYNSTLALQLVNSAAFNKQVAVDSGPFVEDIAHSFGPDGRVVVRKNPRYFSNFFHQPVLDQVTFLSVNHPNPSSILTQQQEAEIALYRSGQLTVAADLDPGVLYQLADLPKAQVVSSPLPSFTTFQFRTLAPPDAPQIPNAQFNGGVSIFTDPNVRRAFVEAFDRCAAARAVLHLSTCSDPNIFTEELSDRPAPDFDPSATLPSYNPTDAAKLLDDAGFRVGADGVRRFKDGTTPLVLSIRTLFPGDVPYALSERMAQDYARNLHVGASLSSGLDNPQPVDITVIENSVAVDQADRFWQPFPAFPEVANDPTVVALRQEAQLTDPRQSLLVYRQLMRVASQLLYAVPIYVLADVELVQPTLCNFKKWPEENFSTWNMADWYLARDGTTCP